MSERTHREIKHPHISARHLADFMAASETARRTIIRSCRYQAIARVIQHDDAKAIISRFLLDKEGKIDRLLDEADRVRNRLADSTFERELLEHNADYVAGFAEVWQDGFLPDVEWLPPGACPPIELNGVKVTVELHARLQRLTRTNKVRIGAAMLRYAKGKELPSATGEWQSAFLFGYLDRARVNAEGASPERQLCLTIDAYAGACHPAPTDSVRRFRNMESACETIAERWPKIAPPPKAVL